MASLPDEEISNLSPSPGITSLSQVVDGGGHRSTSSNLLSVTDSRIDEEVTTAADSSAHARVNIGLEQIDDDGGDGPPPTTDALTTTLMQDDGEKESGQPSGRGLELQQIQDNDTGPSTDILSLEQFDISEKIRRHEHSTSRFHGDRPEEVRADEEPFPASTGEAAANHDDEENLGDESPDKNNDGGGDISSTRPVAAHNFGLSQDPNHSGMLIIPEAYAVNANSDKPDSSEDEVFVASLAQPWWKQKPVQRAFAVICAVAVGAAIAVGVLFSSTKADNDPDGSTQDEPLLKGQGPHPTGAPSFSAIPTLEETDIPSSSPLPTSAPTTCGDRVSAKRQIIDVKLGLSNPSDPRVAIDGNNMAVVTRDENQSSIYVIFFLWNNDVDGNWERVSDFSERYPNGEYSIAMFGKKVFVGFPDARNGFGNVITYEQTRSGTWEKHEKSFIPPDIASHQGLSLDLDGDLACVGDLEGLSIFHHFADKWVPVNRINATLPLQCSISGNNVAVSSKKDGLFIYKYNQDVNGVSDTWELISTNAATHIILNEDLLVYSGNTSVNIYRQGETSKEQLASLGDSNLTFALLQELNSSSYDTSLMALDRNVLIIGGESNSYILSEQNGQWEETLQLNHRYDNYQLSGGSLIATLGNTVHYLNVGECIETDPIQMPTSVASPCYDVEVAISADEGYRASWEIRRIGTLGHHFEIKSYNETHAEAASEETTIACLPRGEYEFTTYGKNECSNMLGCFFSLFASNGGSYSLTSFEAEIHVGRFGSKRTAAFFLPFIPAPSAMPSVSQVPSVTPPSMSPSVSLFPTETCEWITIAMVYDNGGLESSWEVIQKVDASVDEAVIKSYTESDSAASSHIETICLPYGEYIFTLHDSVGGGISFPGHYNITTSSGLVIAQGGEFIGHNHTSTFSIPFTPCAKVIKTLFDVDCDDNCKSKIAVNDDLAVVSRAGVVYIFSVLDFELVAKIEVDYEVSAVAIEDGTLVLGSRAENEDTGTVHIYEKDQQSEMWNQTQHIQPSDLSKGAWFGTSVSFDNDVLVVGANDDGRKGYGSVYVYRQLDNTWVEEAKLAPTDEVGAREYGWSVFIKGDTLAVGDVYHNSDEGAVSVYLSTGPGSWNNVGGTLKNDGCEEELGEFVRLMHDGGLLVTCLSNGVVYYYKTNKAEDEYSLWQNITGSTRAFGDTYSMAVDGDVMVVSGSNIVSFFRNRNGTLEELAIVNDPSLGKYFGEEVAISGDKAIIASRKNVYSYSLDGCIASTASLLLYYPDYDANHCDFDPATRPSWEGVTFHTTAEECCKKWFSWQIEECISLSP